MRLLLSTAAGACIPESREAVTPRGVLKEHRGVLTTCTVEVRIPPLCDRVQDCQRRQRLQAGASAAFAIAAVATVA
eukprot:scaffold7892_cov62-Phaeocystis_antarctica.AAC.8